MRRLTTSSASTRIAILLATGALLPLAAAPSARAADFCAWVNFASRPGGHGNVDGTGIAARFYHSSSVAVDGAGNVYVADEWNHSYN